MSQKHIKVFLAAVLILILLIPIWALCVAILSLSSLSYSDQILVKRTGYGGLCAAGTCEFSITIFADGRIESSNAKYNSKLSEESLKQLVSLLSTSNFKKVAKTKFTGTCPIAYDGLAYRYIFYVPSTSAGVNSDQVDYQSFELDTCKQDFAKLNTDITNFISRIVVE